jgi:hypothetical protein
MGVARHEGWRRVLSRGSVHDWRIDEGRRCCGRGGVEIVRRVIGSGDSRLVDSRLLNSRWVDSRWMEGRLRNGRRSGASSRAVGARGSTLSVYM